jgi:hypothetical protein
MDKVTINGKEYDASALTQAQRNMVQEAMLARSLMDQHEYQLVLLKTRHDGILRILEEELSEEPNGEADQ